MPLRIPQIALAIALLLPVACCWRHSLQQQTPALRLIGDSTMADKPADETPERGWGQLLPQFFSPRLKIINYARNGRSTKSFIDQGLWANVLADINPGDWLFIQFGHNDAKISDSSRYADPHGAYRTNLIRFISESRARKARPLLITPVARRYFSADGRLEDAHGDYPGVVREIAALYDVPLIDLHASSMQLLTALGPEKSERLFMRVPPGLFSSLPEGKSDNTHFMAEGAAAMARLVVTASQKQHHPLAKFLRPESDWPIPPPPPWPIPLTSTPRP
jgi:DNA sulfur modification protein DndE